ncbi:hypothetical protein IFM46972_03607 [Aspergillus udagawae]|uniref:Uncharacterized protein n=1 Tax=Aspergillus udagawae TaxID=91492 RepID=A0A8H3NEG3_9EURO|nr:hypothetical protein IFM46972_03607 [Aspergillus udagawae]
MSSPNLDPEHTACIGGRTVLTCRDCAGNAPRGAHLHLCTLQPGGGCAYCQECGLISGIIYTLLTCITEPKLVDFGVIAE